MKAALYMQRLVPIAGVVLNRLRYPRLWTGLRVEINSEGRISYGSGVRLGEGTRIDVFAGSELSIGDGVQVGRSAYLWINPGAGLSIGSGTQIQDHCRLYNNVTIGKGCVFAPNVFIASGGHAFDAVPHLTIIHQDRIKPALDHPVRVFDDCWFGINAVVAPGITIGRGCVIGANSVVTADLPPYSVAGGNPARVLRTRLAFAPKARIEAQREEDQPYFYDGFDLATTAEAGARAAHGEFVLALKRADAHGIRICLSGEPGEIAYGEHSEAIPNGEGVVEFPVVNGEGLPFLKFHTSARCQVRWAELI
jgi:acetyltransferase-like isoleucine patch superfamily enzyme